MLKPFYRSTMLFSWWTANPVQHKIGWAVFLRCFWKHHW